MLWGKIFFHLNFYWRLAKKLRNIFMSHEEWNGQFKLEMIGNNRFLKELVEELVVINTFDPIDDMLSFKPL